MDQLVISINLMLYALRDWRSKI